MKVFKNNFSTIFQTVVAGIIIMCLAGIYEKLGKLDLLQERQERQAEQFKNFELSQKHQDVELVSLQTSSSYHEQQIKRLQDMADRK